MKGGQVHASVICREEVGEGGLADIRRLVVEEVEASLQVLRV